MAQIQIKRSTTANAATGLAPGELAYTEGLKTLYIGSPTDTDADGTSDSVLTIGGKAYTDMLIPETASNAASIILKEDTSNGAHGITIKAPDAVTADVTLTFPGDDGTANQLLTTDGSGVLSWDDTLSVASIDTSGNVVIGGTLTVSGGTTTVESTTVVVDDPMFALADNNDADAVDIGWYGKYVDDGTKYSGIFRDASDSDRWKIFATTGDSNAAPSTTVDTTSGFALGSLEVSDIKAATITRDGGIANSELANSTISGIGLGSNLNSLTKATNSGLAMTSYTGSAAVSDLAVDLNDLAAAAVDVANDSIAIIDATDNGSKKEAIADFVSGIAGTGLSASGGQLSVTTGTSIDLTSEVINSLPVGNGGTGATTLTDGGILLGSGTGAVTAMAVLADGEMIVGDGTKDPVAESGATRRTSIGVAIGTDVQAYSDALASIAGLSEVAGSVVATTADNTYAAVAQGTSGQVLQSNGSSAPTWVDIDGGSY